MKTFTAILLALALTEARPRDNERVLGGDQASISAYPYQCSLRRYNSHECGCSILTATSVLTAAHCVAGLTASGFSVLAGTADRMDSFNGFLTSVSSYVTYPGFDEDIAGMPNDIAIVSVITPFNFTNPNTQPLTLPSGSTDFTGTSCSVTGWGRTGDPDEFSVFLNNATMPVISPGECYQRNGDLFGRDVFASHICVFDSTATRSACDGDEGGPLTCPEGAENRVVGIMSWVAHTALQRCDPQHASVYTRVTSFLQWISDNAGGTLP